MIRIDEPPVIETYGNTTVVRDDLLLGGTKSRFVDYLFKDIDEAVYATPAEGGAQTALAYAAQSLGVRLTLFVAKRKDWHPRVALSWSLGADIIEVPMGFLSNVQAQAERYARKESLVGRRRVKNLGFGLTSRIAMISISEAAKHIPKPKELWCVSGSGTLARGLGLAWPDVPRYSIQVGHKLTPAEVGGAKIIIYPRSKLSDVEKFEAPFPSDPHYDRKAYRLLVEAKRPEATFWNVAGPA